MPLVRRFLLAALLACGQLLCVQVTHAAEIQVKSSQLMPSEEGYALDAEFIINLGPRLEDVVAHGVALYFVTEFELSRPRWWWADERITGRTQTHRLFYHALTRQYRLSAGALYQNFSTLEEALAVLANLRNWHVADKSLLHAGEVYNAELRMKLDLTQLPKPFQVTSIGNKEWNISAEIKRWSFQEPFGSVAPASLPPASMPPASVQPPSVPPASNVVPEATSK